VLIIKLDAMGDVLRSTCIVPKIKDQFPRCYLTWVTKSASADLLACNPAIDDIWLYDDPETLARLLVEPWDVVYNLDNAYPSSALAAHAKAKTKIGFVLTESGITPTNEAAREWLSLAVFDRLKKQNRCSYQEIMYGICGFSKPICRPYLSVPQASQLQVAQIIESSTRPAHEATITIGINTGSGGRWPKKMLSADAIVAVTKELLAARSDVQVFLLGGPEEVHKNDRIATAVDSGRAVNVGCDHSLLDFAALIANCDCLLCGDTLALHMASALDVPAVAVFGPTSSAEIYDYSGLIDKVYDSTLDCLCCYGDCQKQDNCMSSLSVSHVVEQILAKLGVGEQSFRSSAVHND
jgi:ADP-heptose:LPS heptosyltransferase